TDWELHIVGDGLLRRKIAETARNYDIDTRIKWHGKIPRDQVQELFAQAHLHIITSLGEATTTVLWEAMANGIPTLSLDHCGMSGVICEECGIKIPIHSYEQVTSAIATQIESCIMNPSRIETLSNGVLKCAGKFMWSNRVESFNQIYEQICQKA
ncbi:glycosyltransferase family 4 protein, partial [Alistipes onderdonkii]